MQTTVTFAEMQRVTWAEWFLDKTVEYLTPTISCLILQALDDLQKNQNPPYSRGVFSSDVRKQFMTYKLSTKWLYGDVWEPVWTTLIKLSQFYVDKDFAKFSTKRIDDTYMTWDEMMQKKYPGYVLGNDCIINNQSDILINLDELLALFRSKDIARYHQVKDRFFGKQARYTTANAQEQTSVMYTTYPRAGNSLMRKYFENITGVATGSDMVMKHGPNVALQYCGFKGEGLMDDRAWIKKSHYPIRFHFMKGFDSEIAVICTRNPFDITPSFFYLCISMTHGYQWQEPLLSDACWKYWKQFQTACVEAWNQWHNYWVDLAKKSDAPIYFFRYEDVLANPRQELQSLMKFILGMDSIEGTVIEQRIEDVLAMGKASSQVYKPRSGGSNKNMQNYTAEQIEYQKSVNEELIHFFGYCKDDSIKDNLTPFVDYGGKAKPESVRQINKYKELNTRAFENRRKQMAKYGKRPPRTIHSCLPQEQPTDIKMIRHFKLMDDKSKFTKFTYSHN